MTYKITLNAPKPLDWDSYTKDTIKSWAFLLNKPDVEEKRIHSFLESNPALIPGAFGFLGGTSGHSPVHFTVFSQPKLTGLKSKIPDFMWISKNSDFIEPVLIEIEKPSKKLYNSNGYQTAEFSQAHNQLAEWKTWFDDPKNVEIFKRDYILDSDFMLNRKPVRPQYVLIYGRRYEFENPTSSVNKRANLMRENERIMSYDRISPSLDSYNFICSKLTSNGIFAITFPPYLFFSPYFFISTKFVKDLAKVIANEHRILPERKTFLLERIEYWQNWAKRGDYGEISNGDKE